MFLNGKKKCILKKRCSNSGLKSRKSNTLKYLNPYKERSKRHLLA